MMEYNISESRVLCNAVNKNLSISQHLYCIIDDLVRNVNGHPEDLKYFINIYEFLKLVNTSEVISKEVSEAFVLSCEKLIDKCLNFVYSVKEVDHILFEILQKCIGYVNLEKCLFLLENFEENLVVLMPQSSIENKLLINLLFFDNLLTALSEKLKSFVSDVNENVLIKLNSNKFCNALTEMAFSNNKVIKTHILLSTFPKLLNITNNNLILKYLWDSISLDALETISLNKKLFCLCSLADFYLTYERNSFCLLRQKEFWKIIQLGLIANDPLIRKESVYLLKRAVDTLDQTNTTVEIELFCWKSTNKIRLKQIWELIFIILEVLEEKQAHLVMPILVSVLKIQETCELHDLHPSWLLCIYYRIFKHDSIQVIKLGVHNFLKIDAKIYEKTQFLQTIQVLLEAINNMALFAKESNKLTDLSEIEVKLNQWFLSILKCENCKLFFIRVLSETSKIHWSPVPLFHFLNSLSSVSGIRVWDNSCLNMIRDFVRGPLTTQTVYIRGAIQCLLLRILTNLSDSDVIEIDVFMNTLNAFKHNESLCRGTETWLSVVTWLKTYITDKDAQDFVKRHLSKEDCIIHLSSESLARSIVLLFDAELILNENDLATSVVLADYFECLDGAGVRLYSCIKILDESLKLIKHILLELNFNNSDKQQISNSNLYNVLQAPLTHIVPYLHRRLMGINEINDYYSVEFYISLLDCLSNCGIISKFMLQDLITLQNKAFEISSRSPGDNIHAVKLSFSLQIINWSAKYISSGRNIPSTSLFDILTTYVKNMLRNNRLNIILYKDVKDVSLTRDLQVIWGRIASESIQASWSLLSEYYNIILPTQDDFLTFIVPANKFLQNSLEALQIGGRCVIIYVLDILNIFLPTLFNSLDKIDIQLSLELVASSWKMCFEFRKMELFWTVFKKWISMFFQKDIISNMLSSQYILDYSEQILGKGESITGLVSVFIFHLQKISMNVQGIYLLKNVFIALLTFGPLQRRDQRIENDTIDFIESLGTKFSINELISDSNRPRNDSSVRLYALDMILKAVYNDKEKGHQLAIAMIDLLLDKEQELTKMKQRYYGDSLHHRIKNRILQSLLILESVVAESTSDVSQKHIADLHEWAYSSLKGESQQPSVRYQQEWLFIRTFLHNPTVQQDFWLKFDQAGKERVGSLCSFISIVYHLAVLLKNDNFIEQAIQHILPSCMVQNYNVQLYAQTVLEKILRLSPVINLQYKFLEKCIPANLAQGNAARNALKLKQDFYFTTFHPVNHFSFQTIFYELPRLSNLTSEEWILDKEINNAIIERYSSVPKYSLDSSLSSCQTSSWVVKATESSESSVDALGIQKKFVPWKGMLPDCDIESGDHKTSNDGLVIVASLIDKIPNLGGLCRTCEIFTVSSLVLGSLEYIHNKEFSVLSMSAEKHIQITEVKPHNLAEYLSLMKKSGYTIIGAEQTAGSEMLGTFQFPKKCLLLLGNEKEGIPVNLIHLLDKCVEIPQYGMVRSLNVHVTGALFVWEYTKQYKS